MRAYTLGVAHVESVYTVHNPGEAHNQQPNITPTLPPEDYTILHCTLHTALHTTLYYTLHYTVHCTALHTLIHTVLNTAVPFIALD